MNEYGHMGIRALGNQALIGSLTTLAGFFYWR